MVKKVKRVSKPVFFVVFLLIAAFTLSVIFGFSSFYGDNETVYIKGVDDIRFGIDIKGGVDVTFTPPKDLTPPMNSWTPLRKFLSSV